MNFFISSSFCTTWGNCLLYKSFNTSNIMTNNCWNWILKYFNFSLLPSFWNRATISTFLLFCLSYFPGSDENSLEDLSYSTLVPIHTLEECLRIVSYKFSCCFFFMLHPYVIWNLEFGVMHLLLLWLSTIHLSLSMFLKLPRYIVYYCS